MRVAFLSANRETLPDPVVPLGILQVMAACAGEHEAVLWDLCFARDPVATLRGWLGEFQPEVVALGLRNIQNNDYSGTGDTLRYVAELMQVLRAGSSATVVLGGSGFSVAPAGLMRRLRPDFGISGEGEWALPQLLRCLERDPPGSAARAASLAQIGSLHRLADDGDRVISTTVQSPFLDLDALPMPDRRGVDPGYYALSGIESVQTKRGCPLSCTYCTYPSIEGRRVRQRHPEAVAAELAAIHAAGRANHVFIVDSVFNNPPTHAKAVCRALVARGNTLPWTCYLNPLGFDGELAELMARAGCSGVEIGSDSGTDETLALLKKGFDTAAIRTAAALCRGAGIKDCHTFVLGTPGEKLSHVHGTLDFIGELAPFAAILMAWTDDEAALDAELAARRRTLRAAVIDILGERQRHHPRWIIPPLGVNFDGRLFAFLRRQGLQGPLWQHIHRLPESRAGAGVLNAP